MKNIKKLAVATAITCGLGISSSFANSDIVDLKKRISQLEAKIENSQSNQSQIGKKFNRKIYSNVFNPSIGIVLNGQYSSFSKDSSEFAGFAVGEEGERGDERFSIGESELNFSSNIDDKFFGSLTAAIVREDGEDIIELEEAFIETLPEFGLPTGLSVKTGRAFWKLGYLNEHHAHADDFADRPLPYRAFFNKSFNDDGLQASYVLPVPFYAEVGGGTFRGDDFPFGNGDGTGSYSAYLRTGGDIGQRQNWRIGGYLLSGEAKAGRVTGETGEEVTFIGESDLYIADIRYNFAPTNNAKNQEITLQAEYFHRDEDGTYEDTVAATGAVDFDDNVSGWYAQTVYKFKPQWRVGLRYSELLAADVTNSGLANSSLDSSGHDPKSYSAMIDWTNSEFSRVRLQYNHEELSDNNHDNQVILQYVVSLGAHSAHKY